MILPTIPRSKVGDALPAPTPPNAPATRLIRICSMAVFLQLPTNALESTDADDVDPRSFCLFQRVTHRSLRSFNASRYAVPAARLMRAASCAPRHLSVSDFSIVLSARAEMIVGADGRTRTGTGVSSRGILSP